MEILFILFILHVGYFDWKLNLFRMTEVFVQNQLNWNFCVPSPCVSVLKNDFVRTL